jgi:hypothetical protein
LLALQDFLDVGQDVVDPTEVTSGHHAIQFVVCQEIPDQDRADVVDNLDGAALAMME